MNWRLLIVNALDELGGRVFEAGTVLLHWSSRLDEQWGTGVWDHVPARVTVDK